MLIVLVNSSSVTLEASVLGLDGSPKQNVASGTVRVFHLVSGSEVIDLAATALVRVGTTNVWRYVWIPGDLPVGNYIAEFQMTDTDGATGTSVEDVAVQDPSGVPAQILQLLRKVETNRWKLFPPNNWVLYDDNQTTPLLQFRTFDQDANPSIEDVFERIPI